MTRRPPDEVIGDDYLLRWRLFPRNRWFNVYLHNIRRSDDDRAMHDHPWWYVSVILKGGYEELTPQGDKAYSQGSVLFRKAAHIHRLVIRDSETWTLVVRGPKVRTWGFWPKSGYYVRYGSRDRFVPWYDFLDERQPNA